MAVLLTVAVLTLPAVISGLQTCFPGTETSSTQILLDVSTTQINTRGGMCSCRLTVSQTTQVDMFPVSWTPQCDSYWTIPKWRTCTQCTNGVVQTLPAQTSIVTTDEEIWILVVATKPGVKALSGQVQFKVKQPSGQLNIECFEHDTNSSTTTTTSTTLASTTSSTSRRNVVTTTSLLPKTTRRITSTSQPATHTQTQSSPDITPQGQPTSSPASTAGTRTTEATQNLGGGSEISNDTFPGEIFAAGIATGGGLIIIVQVIYFFIFKPRYRSSCRKSSASDTPMSPAHPTYAGFVDRTEEPVNNYASVSPAQVITNP